MSIESKDLTRKGSSRGPIQRDIICLGDLEYRQGQGEVQKWLFA
jgi:hypothetical protein